MDGGKAISFRKHSQTFEDLFWAMMQAIKDSLSEGLPKNETLVQIGQSNQSAQGDWMISVFGKNGSNRPVSYLVL